MRHVIFLLIAALVVGLAVRVRRMVDQGRGLRAREVAARTLMERLLRAEEQRRIEAAAATDPARRTAPYAFISTLVAEGRLADAIRSGLARVDAAEDVAALANKEVWRAGGYLFEVSLLNHVGHPFKRAPADPAAEPSLGERFEAWGWPEAEDDTSLVVYYASTAGKLIQGENGIAFGFEPALPQENPLKALTNDPQHASDDWIVLLDVRAPR